MRARAYTHPTSEYPSQKWNICTCAQCEQTKILNFGRPDDLAASTFWLMDALRYVSPKKAPNVALTRYSKAETRSLIP
jgi:hypothetical protein